MTFCRFLKNPWPAGIGTATAGTVKVFWFLALAAACHTVTDDKGLAPDRSGYGKPGPIWISAEHLASLPVTGPAWAKVKRAAEADLGSANLAGYTSYHDVKTLAVALAYGRTGEKRYRRKAAAGIQDAMGTEHTGRVDGPGSRQGALAVTLGRNLVSYVIAAELIGLRTFDAQLDDRFRTWIESLRHRQWPDESLVFNDKRHANNHGRMAGAARAAIAVYLRDMEDLRKTARVFKGYLGDRDSYAGLRFRRDLSWQAVPGAPVGINPPGSSIQGFPVDGAQPEEMRRGCSFRVPPCPTHYPWEGLQGILVEAVILWNQGYDVWNWSDQAILRAIQFLERLSTTYPDDGWWASGDDTWVPWVINSAYGTSFPTQPSRMGKNMAWTDWTHGSAAASLP